MDTRETMIAFTDEELDDIISLMEQDGFNTVQETVMNAVRAFLKDD